MQTLTLAQIKEGFLRRDKEAMQRMDAFPMESERLDFAEGRLKDACSIIMVLIDRVDALEKKVSMLPLPGE
jgi:hypothetical protein